MAANKDLESNIQIRVLPVLDDQEKKNIKADLFTKTMKGKWSEVVDIYAKEVWTHKEKITMSGETALHIAVSDGQKDIVKQLIKAIQSQPENHAKEAVNVKNMQGNTALHFAASKEIKEPVMCQSIADVDSSLVGCGNNEGETPFFLAAFHGKKNAFLCLHRICSKANGNAGYDYSTRNDGNTILHSAINGQHFDLAFQITHLYKNLANKVNNKGLYPLHILAAKPSAFRSGSPHGSIWNRAKYNSIFVHELKPEQPRDHEYPKSIPLRYTTNRNSLQEIKYSRFTRFFPMLWKLITDRVGNFYPLSFKQRASRAMSIISYLVHILTSEFKGMLLLPFGIQGYRRRRMMEREIRSSYSIKQKHTWAVQIMNQLLELHTELYQGSKISAAETELEVHDRDSSTNHDREFDHHGSRPTHNNDDMKDDHDHIDQDWELTPILTAAKYGVIEMVERILELYPIAIYDETTVTKKNIVLLAVENRQIDVYQFLLQLRTIPRDSVFGHLDTYGNSALHIAAKLAPGTPGMIAGLRMLWEIKWYQYVKDSMPPYFFPLHNKKGKTPIDLFNKNHLDLVKSGGEWLSRTSESSSVVATLIAGVAFATATNIPGGLKQDSDTSPMSSYENKVALYIFAISSLFALFFSVISVVLFFALMSSPYEVKDFSSGLPKKLLTSLVTLFIGIALMLISFCAAHIFMLQDMKNGALGLYAVVVALVISVTIKNSSVFSNLLWFTFSDAPQRLYEDDL